MKEKRQCPICYSKLETRNVAPCFECGAEETELDEYREDYHKYREYEVFPGVYAVLCDFCDVDFGSYDPTHFGLPRGAKIGLEKMKFVRDIENEGITKDLYCAECGHRLSFLNFLVEAREKNGNRE